MVANGPNGNGRGPGRPSKLTPECKERLVKALEMGGSQKDAALYAGITETTHYNWMAKGRTAKTGEYKEFFVAVTHAIAKGNLALVKEIRTDKDWRAQAHLLACRDPENYNPKHRVQAEVEGSLTLVIKPTDRQHEMVVEPSEDVPREESADGGK